MHKPRDRLQGFPEAANVARPLRFVAKGLNRVVVAVDRMPVRHESARLGEHQEQQAVHESKRFIESGGKLRVQRARPLLRCPGQ